MSMSWSGDDVVCEHRDAKATTAALDCTERFMVLAGRLGIFAIDLYNPQTIVRKVSRKSKWEVSVMQWNHHPQQRHLIAIGSNQKVDIWNFDYAVHDITESQSSSIKGHARSVLDLDWNFAEPTLLVTCSVDNYVNIWDIKDVRKPVASLPSVSGAAQAKWAKVGKNFLATAHEADVKIWDFRKATTPVEYIAAHSAKINGIDWSPSNTNHLVTCGQDSYVKVWDIISPKKPETIIPVTSPVWRARFTPFGEALVTVTIPLVHRGDTSLALWALNDVVSPLHMYSGHSEGVYDFFWRSARNTEYQLVSWSKDQTLRLWKTDASIVKQCGSSYLNHTIVLDHHTDHACISGKENVSQNSAFSYGNSPPVTPTSLDKELRSVEMANVVIENVDLKLRSCVISITAGQHLVRISLSFPLGYPEISCPNFTIAPETTLNPISIRQVSQVITDTFNRCLKNQAMAVGSGIRAVTHFLGTLSSDASLSPRLDPHPAFISPPARQQPAAFKVGPSRFLAQRSETHSPLISAASAKLFGQAPTQFQSEVLIPFPRICGAHFAGDKLVMWSDAWKLGYSSNPKGMIDRSLAGVYPAELSAKQRTVMRQLKKKGKVDKGFITVYNVGSLLPVHPELVANYWNDSHNPVQSFLHNAEVAESVERRDLSLVWRLMAVVARCAPPPESDVDSRPFALHPFGRSMVDDIIQHYRENYDCAFLASLACIFSRIPFAQKCASSSRSIKSASVVHMNAASTSPNQYTIHAEDVMDGWSEVTSKSLKDKRSISWTDTGTGGRGKLADEYLRECAEKDLLDPDPAKREEYDLYKREYCELLHSFRLLNKRAEVLKSINHPTDPHRGIEYYSSCHNCRCEVRGSRCFSCKKVAVSCAICHSPVKGLSTFCLVCGHGGHLVHMEDWFQRNAKCPSGCGCLCLEAMQLAM